MGSCRPGHQRVRCVDGDPSTGEVGLIAPGSGSGLPGGLEEVQPREQTVYSSALLQAGSSDDLRDVYAARSQIVSVCEQVEQEFSDAIVSTQVADEDRGVEEVSAQGRSSVRLVLRTQSLVARRSPQWA
jgi:hypothetical protein